jgi:phosphinothricin acetyltransferase
MSFVIDKMVADDWNLVRVIYAEGIATGHATFEAQTPTWQEWDARHLPYSRLVARADDTIKAWAALSPVSSRFVYAGVAETSIYVGESHRGEGIGKALLDALITDSEHNEIWTLVAGIFPENNWSLAMYKQCGFREIGRRERIGKMRGAWRDIILLERRSTVVGVD